MFEKFLFKIESAIFAIVFLILSYISVHLVLTPFISPLISPFSAAILAVVVAFKRKCSFHCIFILIVSYFYHNSVLDFLAKGDLPIYVFVSFLALYLQSSFTKYLIARTGRNLYGFDNIKDIFLFILLAGVLPCLLIPTVNYFMFLSFGANEELLAMNWIIDWIANIMGVIIIAPPLIVLLAQKEGKEFLRRKQYLVSLLINLTLLPLLFFSVVKYERSKFDSLFTQYSKEAKDLLEYNFGNYTNVVIAMQSFFHSSDHVSREEFHSYSKQFLRIYPSIKALEWAPKISHNNLEEFLSYSKEVGVSDFVLKENKGIKIVLSQPREVYYPVLFVEPPGNEFIIGYDLYSDNLRKKAIDKAIKEDYIVATEPINLMKMEENNIGFLLLGKVYREDNSLDGVVLAVIRLSDVVEEILNQKLNENINITIKYRDKVLYSEQDIISNKSIWKSNINLADKNITLEITPTIEFVCSSLYKEVVFLILGGVVLAFLLNSLLFLILAQNNKVHKQVEAQTWDLNRINNELATTIDELKKSNEELEHFAYSCSHDLQEPLRIMSSYAELLKKNYEDKLDKKGIQYIDYIVDGSIKSRELILDILSYSRVSFNSGDVVDVDTEEVLDAVLQELSLSIEENKAEITRSPLPVIRMNKTHFFQLLQNLINNALKYRKLDAPKISISATYENGYHIFQVVDNGIGIEKEYYTQIFELFRRLHHDYQYSGTGVGLAICKKIVEYSGGKLWVESEVGVGSKFCFSIPDLKSK